MLRPSSARPVEVGRMTTQSHAILNIAILSKRYKPYLHSYAFLGAVLPDVPIFIFFAVEAFLLRTPQREMWGSRYFMEAWQNFFDIFNAVPLILIVFGIGYFLTAFRADDGCRLEYAYPLRF